MMGIMANLVEHLELFLGRIDSGTGGDDTTPAGVQAIRFGPDRPFAGVTTWTTLGLSNHHLEQPNGRGLHQELVMHVPTDREPPNIAGILFQVAEELIQRGRGLGRGEVLGPRGRLFSRGEMVALAAAPPLYLPDAFAVCDAPAAPIVLTWLVPLTEAEAEFVHARGWGALSEIFLAQDPDLSEIERGSVPLAP
jgi:Suppressor of fused protein (SUFU)